MFTNEELTRLISVIEGIMKAIGDKRMSFAALGVYVEIADDDNQKMAVDALVSGGRPNDERQVLAALQELQRAGYVRLESAPAGDPLQTTTAYLIH